jgi:hypothetical protein
MDIQSILFSCGVVHLRFIFLSFLWSSPKTILKKMDEWNGESTYIMVGPTEHRPLATGLMAGGVANPFTF